MHFSIRFIKVCVLQFVWRRFGACVFWTYSFGCASFFLRESINTVVGAAPVAPEYPFERIKEEQRMKKVTSIILSLVILIGVFASVPITAGAVRSGDYQYGFIGSKGIVIEHYYGKDEILNIPSEIDGYTVIGIGSIAFWMNNSLVEVTIPNTITEIEDEAFEYCDSLRTVTIGNKVETIGDETFRDCTSLQKVTIGNNVKTIGAKAFENCTGLTDIIIPDKVTEIGNGAFYGCVGITSINLGKSVETIGASAFEKCSSLESIIIPNNVKQTSYSALDYCTSLKSITLPNTIDVIPDFIGCEQLSDINFEGTNHEWEKILGYNGYIDINNYKYKNANVHFLKKVSLSKCKVSPIGKHRYNGNNIKPNITIKDRKFHLSSAIDYKLSFKKNKNVGKATVIIEGKGCYTGTIKKTFKIVKAKNPMKVSKEDYLIAFPNRKTTFKNVIKVKKAKGKVRYKKISGNSHITVNSKTGAITVKSGLPIRTSQRIKIKVTASGNKNFLSKSKKIFLNFWITS